MAELYDWEKDEKPKMPFTEISRLASSERILNVKPAECQGHEKLIIKGVISTEDRYKELKAMPPKRKYNLVGSISTAINRALNTIAPNRTQKLGKNILLKPDSDGRLYFTINDLRYYIDKSRTKCVDEEGYLWLLDLANSDIYEEREFAYDFDYEFVSPELERAYYDSLENKKSWNPYDHLFKRTSQPTDFSGKVVDFAAYREKLGPRR